MSADSHPTAVFSPWLAALALLALGTVRPAVFSVAQAVVAALLRHQQP